MDDLSLWVIIAQLINFWIIFFIFYYFLWDKIVKIIEERREKIASLDNSDLVVRKKLEEAQKEADEILLKAKEEALKMQKNAEDIVKRETSLKIQEAETKARNLEESALRDIEKERLSMLNSLKEKIFDVSLKINSKIFEDTSKNKEFIQKEINSIKL